MKKFSSLLAVAVAISGAASAQAGFIITSTTTPSVVTPGSGFTAVGGNVGDLVDVIALKIQNDGITTGTKVVTMNLTVTTPGSGATGAMVFKATDVTFNPGGGLTIDNTAQLGSAGQNIAAFGSPSGSFLRFGGTSFLAIYNHNAVSTSLPGGNFPENRQDAYGATISDPPDGVDDTNAVANYTNNHVFEVQGGILNGISGITPQNLGTIVVPRGTIVSINGVVAGDLGDPSGVPVSFTSIPEPASLSLLALGGLALLARRRKA